jgi:hypothetical protein
MFGIIKYKKNLNINGHDPVFFKKNLKEGAGRVIEFVIITRLKKICLKNMRPKIREETSIFSNNNKKIHFCSNLSIFR